MSPSSSQLPAAQVGDVAAGAEAQLRVAALDDRPQAVAGGRPGLGAADSIAVVLEPAEQVDPLDLRHGLANLGVLRPVVAQEVDVAGAGGRAHRERRVLGLVVGGLQDVPALAELGRERQLVAHRGLRVVGEQDQRVVGEEPVQAAGRLDELRERGVGALDRVDGRRRPVAV